MRFQLGWLMAFILTSLVNELSWWWSILPTISLAIIFAGAFFYGLIRSFKK
jgi:hypothetical protein